MRASSAALAFCLWCAVPGWAGNPDDFSNLLRRVPENANALVLIDRDALLSSNVAIREGWAKRSEANYLAGTSTIPPGTSKLIFAAQLKARTLANAWEIGLAQTNRPISMAEVARVEKNPVEKLAEFPTVLSPRDAYFVEFGPHIIGTLQPADRQELARWLRFAKGNRKPVVSSYLQDSLRNVTEKSQIVLAIDTLDMADVPFVRAYLRLSKVASAKKVNPDAVASLLAGLRGARMTISVHDTMLGELRLDFAESTQPVAGFIKPLVLEALDQMGAALGELADWKVAAVDRSVVFTGTLSTTTLRQLLAPVHTPAPTNPGTPEVTSVSPPAKASSATANNPQLDASLAYYQSIQTILNDIAEIKSKSYNGIAYWYEKYAKQIDQLPILDVDPEVRNYGLGVTVMLRTIAGSLRGQRISNELLDQYESEVSFLDASNPWHYYAGPGYGYGYPWWGGWYGYPSFYYSVANNNQITRIQSQSTAVGDAARKTAWNLVLEKSTLIRERMVAKYHVEFPATLSTQAGTSQLKAMDKPK